MGLLDTVEWVALIDFYAYIAALDTLKQVPRGLAQVIGIGCIGE